MPTTSRISVAPIEKLLYARKDVAHALSISLSTVDRMIASQEIRTRRLRGRVLVDPAEVRRIADRILRHDIVSESAPPRRTALQIIPSKGHRAGKEAEEDQGCL